MKHYIVNFLLNPSVIFFSALMGILIGLYSPTIALLLKPYGSIYLQLLQMLVLPVLMTAIISGMGRLFISGSAKNHLVVILFFIIANLLFSSIIGVTVGQLAEVGKNLGEQAEVTLGKIISTAESVEFEESSSQKNEQLAIQQASGFLLFIKKMIPTNIFQALVNGDNLAILFFSILVGISMGLLKSNTDSKLIALSVVDAFYEAFLTAIGWMMYLLPFGLCCLFASQMAQVGVEVFLAMSKLVLFIYISALILIFIFSLLIWYKSSCGYWQTLSAVKQPFFVALGTSSSLASIPVTLTALQQKLHVNRNVADLLIPLGMTINPPGSVLYFAITCTFFAQIYDVSLGLNELFIIVLGAFFAGISSASAPGIVGLSMISIVLTPLGLPIEIAIILLIAIDPLIDPILTGVNVFSNCAMTMFATDTTQSSESS